MYRSNNAANEETVRVLRSIGAEAYAYQVDLTKKEDIYRVAAATKRDVGQVLDSLSPLYKQRSSSSC